MMTEDFQPPSPNECLEDFIVVFKASLDPRLWLRLIEEESEELLAEEPGTANHLKEAADLMYVLEGFSVLVDDDGYLLVDDEEAESIDKTLDDARGYLEAAENFYSHDTVYDAFLLVHDSNMSKLDEDGSPIFRADGKVLKGPNYKAPDLTHLL